MVKFISNVASLNSKNPSSLPLSQLKLSAHGVYTSTCGLLLAFMLLEQLFKFAPCGLVRDSAGMLSFSFCQMAHNLKKLAEI